MKEQTYPYIKTNCDETETIQRKGLTVHYNKQESVLIKVKTKDRNFEYTSATIELDYRRYRSSTPSDFESKFYFKLYSGMDDFVEVLAIFDDLGTYKTWKSLKIHLDQLGFNCY